MPLKFRVPLMLNITKNLRISQEDSLTLLVLAIKCFTIKQTRGNTDICLLNGRSVPNKLMGGWGASNEQAIQSYQEAIPSGCR